MPTYDMASHHGLHKVKLVRNPHYVRDGVKSYAHMMRKYTFTPTLAGPFTIILEAVQEGFPHILRRFHPHKHSNIVQQPRLVRRNAAGEVGEVNAEDIQNDSEYLAQVGIGSPAQHFNLDFDTGSSDLWVWSDELSNTIVTQGKKSGHVIFEPAKSGTYKKMSGESWKIQYGDGSTASGDVGMDDVTVGGLKIKNQGVELAKQMSSTFQTGAPDGLLGLAFSKLNTATPTQLKTVVENMITQSDIDQDSELFTAYLTNEKDKQAPFYTFGVIDHDTVNANGGTINYTPIDTSNGFWQFDSPSSSVNGQEIQIPQNTAIADTGTTLALVDDETCKAVYNAIPGATYDQTQGGYIFPSSVTADQLPTVTFSIGDNQLTLHKEDLAFANVGNGMVYGGVQSRGNMTFSIFGDTCMKAMYAIFDQGNGQFGFVQKPDPSSQTSTTMAVAVNPHAEHKETERKDTEHKDAEHKDAAATHQDSKTSALVPSVMHSTTASATKPTDSTVTPSHSIPDVAPLAPTPHEAASPAPAAALAQAPLAPVVPSTTSATTAASVPTAPTTKAAPAPSPAAPAPKPVDPAPKPAEPTPSTTVPATMPAPAPASAPTPAPAPAPPPAPAPSAN